MIPRHLTIGVAVMLVISLGAGFYAWRMRGRATTPAVASKQPLPPPASGPTEQATLYVADDSSGTLHAMPIRIALPAGRQERAEELLRGLLDIYLGKSSPHVLGAGSEIRAVYLVDPGLVVIDLNAAFANTHRSGILVEELTLASLVASLRANIPGITQVRILVDGKERETLAGHADLTRTYDLSAMNQLVSDMTPQQ